MAERTRILVVEDDLAIRRGVVQALRHHGYAVLEAGDGVAANRMAREAGISLVLLDLVLPLRDGLAVLERIRQDDPTLPVIVVTARGDENQRVEGLERGADDYVVKPFSARELLARVEAVLRRSPERAVPVQKLSLPQGEVDLARQEIRFCDGRRVALTRLEASLLSYLVQRTSRTLSREELLARVWGSKGEGLDTRCVDMTVARLRKKMQDGGETTQLVTVRGRGYRYEL